MGIPTCAPTPAQKPGRGDSRRGRGPRGGRRRRGNRGRWQVRRMPGSLASSAPCKFPGKTPADPRLLRSMLRSPSVTLVRTDVDGDAPPAVHPPGDVPQGDPMIDKLDLSRRRVARAPDPSPSSRSPPPARHRAGVDGLLRRLPRPRHLRLRGVSQPPLPLGRQVRVRHRLALLHPARLRGRRGHDTPPPHPPPPPPPPERPHLRHGPHRGPLRPLRRPPRPRLPRWAATDRRALLHELGGPQARAPRERSWISWKR